jgi:hypothetical protein
MACSINLRTHLLNGASTGGTWTYNGYSASFDGDEDNLAQFGASGSNPPEELPTAGLDLVGDDPTLDANNHDVGFYSFTYALNTGTCSMSINKVLPIVEGPDNGGRNAEIIHCPDLDHLVPLWHYVTNGYNTEVDETGTWTQFGGNPNPHPGFFDGGGDPTAATFDLAQVNYPWEDFPFGFQYTLPDPVPPEGYEIYNNCNSCLHQLGLVSVGLNNQYECCTGVGFTYTTLISNETIIYGFELEDSQYLNNFQPDNPNPYMNFPYTVPFDNAQLTADLTNWLQNNGGGWGSSTPATPPWNTLRIIDPCVEFVNVCLDEGCTSTIPINIT